MACEPRNLKRTATGEMLRLIKIEPEEFTPEEDELYLEGAWKRFQEIVNEICEIAFTDTFKLAVKGDWCFRNNIYPEYKANRGKRPDKRNTFVPILRKRAAAEGMAVEAHGFEADDMLRFWQQEAVKEGKDYAIFSIDKDLLCIPGAHYLLHKNQWRKVTEPEAERFYFEQLLKGDPTDNIKGLPGVGPVRAEKYLEGCDNVADMQATVIMCYKAAFGETWEKELTLTGNMIYLLKHPNDKFSFDDWNVYPDTLPEVSEPSPPVAPVKFEFKKHWPSSDTPVAVEAPLPEAPSVPIPVFCSSWGKKP